MKTFSIKEAVKHGYRVFKSHKKVLILSSLIWIVLSNIDLYSDSNRFPYDIGLGLFLASIVVFASRLVVEIGWFNILLKLEGGERPFLGELFSHTNIFWKYLGAYILYCLAVVIGLVLFIAPGLYMLVKYGFTLPIIVERKNISIKEAFAESARLSDGIKWKLLGFFCVLLLLNILGVAALLVGVLVSLPVTALAYIHIYRKLSKKEA